MLCFRQYQERACIRLYFFFVIFACVKIVYSTTLVLEGPSMQRSLSLVFFGEKYLSSEDNLEKCLLCKRDLSANIPYLVADNPFS